METTRIEPEEIASLDIVQKLLSFRQQLGSNFGTSHGNARLELIDVLIVLLAAFYNPMVRSQRLIDALSSQDWMQERTGLARIPRSTLSDALTRFDPEQLKGLIGDLCKKVGKLDRKDPDLALLTKQVIAADGTYFNLAGEVLWALACRRGSTSKCQSRVRLDLQLDIISETLLEGCVSGLGSGSEPKVLMEHLRSGAIYLIDRLYMHFGFLNAVLEKGSSFVVRLKKNIGFTVKENAPLVGRDKELGITEDQRGFLSGPVTKGNQGRGSRTGKPPAQELRRVVVWDPQKREYVMLLTDMLDVPAYVIAMLYRKRWMIELFLRFLKCTACFDHLISKSKNGITLQLYVAMIATLLLHLATGKKVSKYSLFWLSAVASGQATWEQMEAGLARIEREKELERIRRNKKRLLASGLPAEKTAV
jgi:Transposase DDE domain